MLATHRTISPAGLTRSGGNCLRRQVSAKPCQLAPRSRRSAVRAVAGPNFFVELLTTGVAGTIVAAVTTATAENREAEFERIKTLEGAAPLAAAIVADTVAHSIPGLNLLLGLLTEPAGAAAGVAYMMSLVLSSPAVDPKTLAPAGTILNAAKADDVRAAVRVPFTRIIPTLLKVVDTTNDMSSGKGWAAGSDGLPKLPITSVVAVIGVGGIILETISHAPVLSLLLPRVLCVAFWVAAAGYVLDKRES